jgi:hypothetical protein
MRELEIRPTKVASQWAITAFVINVLFIYILYFTGVDSKSPINYVAYLPFVICLFLSVKFHKEKELNGYISFKRAFGTGFRYSSLLSLLMGLFMYVYLKWLNQDVFEQGLITAENEMIDKGTSSDQIDMAIEMARNWGPLIAAFTTAFMYTLSGAAISLVVASILKNEEPLYAQSNEEE